MYICVSALVTDADDGRVCYMGGLLQRIDSVYDEVNRMAGINHIGEIGWPDNRFQARKLGV